MNSVDTDVPENTFSSQEHNSILTDAEADKFNSEADEMNREIVRKLEVHEEANKVIDKEAEIETLTDEELFQDFTPRPLIDDTDEDPINTEILEEESSEFEGYDR
ncbi:16831_t:CDS:2, partial [Cetraspora pellucida]